MSTTRPAAAFVRNGRVVEPSRGWRWIVEGFELFRRDWGVWIAIIVIAALIYIALAMIPVLGSLAGMVLAPVFAGGLVIGCREQAHGRELRIAHLFAGFQERFGTLVSIGLIYLGVTVAIALVVGLVTGSGVWGMLASGADVAAVAGAGATLLLAFLVMMALLIPVIMAAWFAPALAVFQGQRAGEAMLMSFTACLKNFVPFLVYGVTGLVLALAASIPFGLGWLVLGPTLAASLYTGYRDIFLDEGAAAPQPGEPRRLHAP